MDGNEEDGLGREKEDRPGCEEEDGPVWVAMRRTGRYGRQ